MQYQRVVHKGEVATKLIWRIGITPAIKNINSLSVNAQIPENTIFNELREKEDPNKADANSKKQRDKVFLDLHLKAVYTAQKDVGEEIPMKNLLPSINLFF